MEVCPWSLPTAEVEALLRTRAHHDALASYFGGAHELAELRELQRAGEGVAQRARVLLLPGTLGSKLGTPRPWPLPAKLGWVGPRTLVGALRELSLDCSPRLHAPLGVFEFVYLRCKLHLRAAGFVCEFWPFDWRDSVQTCAARLAAEIARAGQRVSLVGHSMGGLVALAALREARARALIDRCVLVGAPIAGAHAAVGALRGTQGLVDWLQKLDVTSNSSDLAREVWSSFPSVYDLLPADVSQEQLAEAGVPSRAALHAARRNIAGDASHLRSLAGLVHVVAGEGVQTPAEQGEEVAGDGTVLLASAMPEDVPGTVLQGVSHTQLVRDGRALGAIVDALGAAPRGQSVRPVAGRVQTPGITYLLARATRTPTHRLLRVSVLPARGGACVPAGGALVSSEQLAKVYGRGSRPQDVAALGEWLGEHALPGCVRDALAQERGALVLLCDREASGLPWEALRVGGRALSVGRVMTRVLECSEDEAERGGRASGVGDCSHALIVANPTADLPKAGEEGERVRALLAERGIASVVLREGEATRARVREALAAGPGIVHLAGHAFFDAARPAKSGVRLSDGVLTGEGLLGTARRAGSVPGLVVLNACESARTREGAAEEALGAASGAAGCAGSSVARGARVGFAETLLRGGVRSVVGTWWPVLDSSAMVFAESMYGAMSRTPGAGVGVGEAVRAARDVLASSGQAGQVTDSVNYVLWGAA